MTKSTNKIPTKHCLELEESAGVGESGEDVDGASLVNALETTDGVQVEAGVEWRILISETWSAGQVEAGHHIPGDGEALLLVPGKVVSDPRHRAVQCCSPQLLSCDHFTSGSLDQGWTSQVDVSNPVSDDGHI